MKAIEAITSALGRLNVLSPGEAASADDAAYGFDQVNELVDEMSAQNQFLFQELKTSAVQTGHITLGAGAWAAIPVGAQIVALACNALPLPPMDMAQYLTLAEPATVGAPQAYVHDGAATVYLYPVPAGQTIAIETRQGVQAFADQTTDYTVPPGYRAWLVAALAVRLAPSFVGKAPEDLRESERRLRAAVRSADPAILDAGGYHRAQLGNILAGWR